MNYNLPNFLLCPDLAVSMVNTLSRKYIENKKKSPPRDPTLCDKLEITMY